MGFLARIAAKSEARTMGAAHDAVEFYTDLAHGPINIPCHIVPETHLGMWVGSKDDDGQLWLGVYRCQFHFWSVELSKDNVEGAKSKPIGWLQTRQLNGDRPVTDLGRMDNGDAPALAYGLTMIDYK
jgi:hypothetical protein